jgi:hypothetical protein
MEQKNCALTNYFAHTLENKYNSSLFPRRWMLRYCSKEHFTLGKKLAWKRVYYFIVNFALICIQFTLWCIRSLFLIFWRIMYAVGIGLVVILYIFAAIAFWSMVFDILNPHKKVIC